MKTLPKATKRNSINIKGQLWHFRRKSYWTPDTAGGYTSSIYDATRYSDGRTVSGSAKERLAAVIEERIEQGIY